MYNFSQSSKSRMQRFMSRMWLTSCSLATTVIGYIFCLRSRHHQFLFK